MSRRAAPIVISDVEGSAPWGGLLKQLTRRLGLTRNPLCRRVDRIEGAVRLLLALFVLAALAVSTVIALNSYATAASAAAAERHQLRQVEVVLLEDAPSSVSDPPAAASPPQPGVQARWTLPDGSTRVGGVYIREAAISGESVQAWMNAFYDPVRPPAERDDLVMRAALMGLVVATLSCSLFSGAYQLARRQLNRRRDTAWTREWLLVSNSWRDRSM
jgi:hypothetical protein